MKYEVINPKEDLGYTRELLNKKWDENTRDARQEKYNLNAADCKIYMRGQVWIIEHENDLLYFETHSDNYPFFEMAFHYMNVENRASWKTVGELITFRQAIREATVQGTDYCETILEEPLTTRIYKKFMRFSRSHDLYHHGSHTF